MQGPWESYKNYGLDKPYQVGRIKDTSEPLHGGNVEMLPEFYASKVEALAVAEKLNREEELK